MEREKMGFNIPYEKWFKAELKELLIQTLDSNSLNKYQILNTTIIEKITKTYFLDTKIDFQRLWSILVFQLWFNKWMK